MNLIELKNKLPEPFHPWADTYGTAFLSMTSGEVKAWIETLIRGDTDTAYKTVLARMETNELLNEWNKTNAAWHAANETNFQRLELQQAATAVALKAMLTVALSAVCL